MKPAGVLQCGGRIKSLHTSSECRLYFISFGIIDPILVILKIEYHKPVLGGVCSLGNYSVAYEATQSNRVSTNFRDFLCSLFPKAIFFFFFFSLLFSSGGFHLAVQAAFSIAYNGAVECRPLNPANSDRF